MRCYHFFIFEVIAESVNLIHSLIADVKIEQKINPHDGEQLLFKKLTSKHTEKERCACNYTIARNEEFQCI